MQEPLLSPTVFRKIYSQRGIMIASLLASPLVCGILLAKNCIVLDRPGKKRQAWLLCGGAMAVVVTLALLLPESVPSFVFIFLNTAFGWYAPQYLLGGEMEEHISNGGPVYSNWRSAGIALAVVLCVVAVWLLAFVAMDAGKW